MAHGLRIWDALGNLTMDTSTRMSRLLGAYTIPTGSATGSFSDAGFAQGTPWWSMVGGAILVGGPTASYFNITPQVSVTGNVLSWDWASLPRSDVILLYGVY